MSARFVMTGAEPDELWPLIKRHHYSCRRMPKNIHHCYAIREAGGFFGDTGPVIAGIIFSTPPTRWAEEVIELSRLVRTPECQVPLSSLVAFACKWLRKAGWPLVVSFADWTQKHHGGIYQASGWNYGGCRERRMDGIIFNGEFKPGRSCNHAWGTQSPDRLRKILPGQSIEPHYDDGKHIYWLPLTIAGRSKARRLDLKKLPYPKPNAARPLDEQTPVCASAVQPRGAAPTICEAAE